MLHHCITAHEQTQIETESAIFVSLMCSLFPADLHSELIIPLLQLVLCHVTAIKLGPYIIIMQIIFSGPLESLGSFRVSLKMNWK